MNANALVKLMIQFICHTLPLNMVLVLVCNFSYKILQFYDDIIYIENLQF